METPHEREVHREQIESLLSLAEEIQAKLDRLERVRSIMRVYIAAPLIAALFGITVLTADELFFYTEALRALSLSFAVVVLVTAIFVASISSMKLRRDSTIKGGRSITLVLIRIRLDDRIDREYRALQATLDTIRETNFLAELEPIERAEVRIRLSRFSVSEDTRS